MGKLTDSAIKNIKPAEKPIKLFDGGGLFLLVTPAGGKLWRQKYRVDGKERLLAHGAYPAVSLKEARTRQETAMEQLSAGIDPSAHRKAAKAAVVAEVTSSLEVITREWFYKARQRLALSTAEKTIRLFERDIFPVLGGKEITIIKSPELLACLQRIEQRGAIETAHRALSDCGKVWRYAIATGRAEINVTSALRGALTPATKSHFAAVTEPSKVGGLLRTLDAYTGSFVVCCALKLAPLVFVRPCELRKAEWAAIDLEAGEWRYTASKTETAHVVPLSTQALAILRDIHALTGTGIYVFPSARTRTRPMSDNAILGAMRRLGIAKDEMSGHGFRVVV